MAGSQVNDYGVGDTNLTSLMNTADTQRIGYHSVSLTNYATTTVPAIAEGSVIEIAGALFEFQADEAITGSPADGTVYIKLTAVGTSVTAAFATAAPTWDTEKQGWYEAGTNKRYLNFGMVKATASYTKYQLIAQGTLEIKAYASGNFECDDAIVTGEVRDSNNIPVMGFLDDGTRLFAKWLSGTILNGTTSVSIAHGIANARSGKKILQIIPWIAGTGGTAGMYTVSMINVATAADYIPTMSWYDDTNVNILRGLNTTQYEAHALVIYKA